jgi:hypothetical protein
MMAGMKFTIRDILALMFFVAIIAAAQGMIVRMQNPLAVLPFAMGLGCGGLGVLALLFGARERKLRDDDRRRNSQN